MKAKQFNPFFYMVTGSPVTVLFIEETSLMFTFKAAKRKEQGTGASRRLRRANKFPAIIYGGTEPSIAIELDHDAVMNQQDKTGFYTDPLMLVVDGQEICVKLQAIQRHPFKLKYLHIDFIRI